VQLGSDSRAAGLVSMWLLVVALWSMAQPSSASTAVDPTEMPVAAVEVALK